jgi:hypothetical protein
MAHKPPLPPLAVRRCLKAMQDASEYCVAMLPRAFFLGVNIGILPVAGANLWAA